MPTDKACTKPHRNDYRAIVVTQAVAETVIVPSYRTDRNLCIHQYWLKAIRETPSACLVLRPSPAFTMGQLSHRPENETSLAAQWKHTVERLRLAENSSVSLHCVCGGGAKGRKGRERYHTIMCCVRHRPNDRTHKIGLIYFPFHAVGDLMVDLRT